VLWTKGDPKTLNQDAHGVDFWSKYKKDAASHGGEYGFIAIFCEFAGFAVPALIGLA
jgi:hypothetical protein